MLSFQRACFQFFPVVERRAWPPPGEDDWCSGGTSSESCKVRSRGLPGCSDTSDTWPSRSPSSGQVLCAGPLQRAMAVDAQAAPFQLYLV